MKKSLMHSVSPKLCQNFFLAPVNTYDMPQNTVQPALEVYVGLQQTTVDDFPNSSSTFLLGLCSLQLQTASRETFYLSG